VTTAPALPFDASLGKLSRQTKVLAIVRAGGTGVVIARPAHHEHHQVIFAKAPHFSSRFDDSSKGFVPYDQIFFADWRFGDCELLCTPIDAFLTTLAEDSRFGLYALEEEFSREGLLRRLNSKRSERASVAVIGALFATVVCSACEGAISGGGLRATPGTQNEPGPVASPGDPIAMPEPSPESLVARRIVRLSDRQLNNSFKALLSDTALDLKLVSSGSSPSAFYEALDRTPMNDALAEQIQSLSEALGQRAEAKLSTIFPCPASTLKADTCVKTWLSTFVGRAFRRTLEPEEIANFAALFEAGAQGNASSGVRLVVAAVVQAPSFLYRTELGTGPGAKMALTDFEAAAQLSYWLLDAPPDDALWTAASNGTLSSAQGLESEAARLIAQPSTQEHVADAYLRWTGIVDLPIKTKDPILFPQFSAAASQLVESARRSIQVALFSGPKDFSTLFSSTQVFVNSQTAPYFQVPAPSGSSFQSVSDPAHQGLLGHPAFLARYGSANEAQVVQRGAFVTKEVLCIQLSPPPAGLDIEGPGKGLSPRAFANYRAATPACRGCHQSMDPFGLAMYGFDAVGKARQSDSQGPIDTSVAVLGTDFDGVIAGAAQLSSRLATSRQSAECAVAHLRALQLGTSVSTATATNRHLTDGFVAKGRSIEKLVADIAGSESFRFRQ
jgi:Protein of unknown function (DUF1592)/Protein of unknown function (DUF1588)/Protein of unknown function (DUF1595)